MSTSAAVLEFVGDEVEGSSSVDRGIVSSPLPKAGAEAGIRLEAQGPTPLLRVVAYQAFTDQASFDKFIAKEIATVSGVKVISRHRLGEKFRFYVVIDDSDPKTMDDVFEVEKQVYGRFDGDDLEFEILPGEELGVVIPTDAISLWRAS